MKNRQSSPRLWEIDTARGIAVVAMVVFHLMWDLQYVGLSRVDVFSAPWQIFARSIGISFTFLLGLSLWLVSTRLSRRELWRTTVRRSITLIVLGLVITAGTSILVGDGYVRFGILHLLGSMLILSLPFITAPLWVTFSMALVLLSVGAYFTTLSVSFPWLIWIGVTQRGIEMVDYYPLLPWGGAALLGILSGRLCYPDGGRRVRLPDLSALAPIRALRLLGRHSLLVYILHQPILLSLLFAFQALAGSR